MGCVICDVGRCTNSLAFREAASIFGDEHFNVQSLPGFFNHPVLKHTFNITKDGFVINNGGGAIGPEIVANRLAGGPMWYCPECKAEEFFLTSYAVGDPGMWVDLPANGCVQEINNPIVNGLSAQPARTPYTGAAPNTFPFSCDPRGTLPTTPGPKATVALYPDNPSNVHHSYISGTTSSSGTSMQVPSSTTFSTCTATSWSSLPRASLPPKGGRGMKFFDEYIEMHSNSCCTPPLFPLFEILDFCGACGT